METWNFTFGDRLMVGGLPLKQEVKVRVLLPELFRDASVSMMRGRLTVGCDALNVAMLVRFQLPQLGNDEKENDECDRRKSSGWMRNLS